MKTRLYNLWYAMHSSYWFVPTLMTVASIALALAMLWIDGHLGSRLIRYRWAQSLGAEGSRLILSSIATSMITVAGVVFSITIVAFTLAATQFGPRILNHFMRDTGNQIVLGTFIATFIYSLIIMGTIRGEENSTYHLIPHLSVLTGLLLAIASLGVLIYFIHHASLTIQVTQVIASIARDLNRTVLRVCEDRDRQCQPMALESDTRKPRMPDHFEQQACHIQASHDGYLQAIDFESLMRLTVQHDLIIKLTRRPGHFVTEGTSAALVWPGERVDPRIARRIRKAFLLGSTRTYEQDIEFAVHQLVEIALRALSPSLNDPTTANMCLDRLGAALGRLAHATMPPIYRHDEQGRLRLIEYPETYAGIVDAAFDQIRQNATGQVAVVIHMLEVLAIIAEEVQDDTLRQTLRRQALMIHRDSMNHIPEENDRADVEHSYQNALRALAEDPARVNHL